MIREDLWRKFITFHASRITGLGQFFSELPYTNAYNKVYQRRGALFIDYLRRKRVENQRYFIKLVHYIHYNPVHHGFCQNVEDWPYSSYRAVLSQKESKVEKETVLAWFGGRPLTAPFIKPRRKQETYKVFQNLIGLVLC
ncbi:MAG: hypothetical protein HC875_31500 [Anaerolineales bacterium]|nr:hypothetical protein [Anaerolineales bacterium]